MMQWLQITFNAVQDVKSAANYPDNGVIFQPYLADLVVQTWMGAWLNVYLVDKEPRTRDLRATLKENTRCGIGSLFVVSAALLPEHGRRLKLDDWQVGFMGMNDGWIYAYSQREAAFALSQVHFSATGIVDELYCWHLPDFQIETVHVRRRQVQHGLKGEWLVGDIASQAYKRRVNYERQHQRFHYHTKSTRETHRAPSDHLDECYRILNVARSASEREVKIAYRRMALQVHPDVSALPRWESERRIKEINRAYETIKDHHGWS